MHNMMVLVGDTPTTILKIQYNMIHDNMHDMVAVVRGGGCRSRETWESGGLGVVCVCRQGHQRSCCVCNIIYDIVLNITICNT